MSAAATVSVHGVRAMLFGAAAYGLAPSDLCARFGLSPEVLADDESRIPVRIVLALWTELPLLSGDPCFGLHLGEQMPVPSHPVLGYAMRNSATFGDALRCFLRYQRLAQNATVGEFTVRGAVARVTIAAAREVGVLSSQGVEYGFASAVALGHELTRVDLAPRAVHFAHAAPTDATEHRRVFRCGVHFSAGRNVLEFDAATLALALPAADATLAEVLERYARHLASSLPTAADLASQVRAVVNDALRGGDPSLESVARVLRTSPRTLQRRLRSEGTSHQDLLEAERERHARQHLAESNLTIKEIAFLLGFAEQASFHRAFARWAGITPGAFRSGRRRAKAMAPA